MTDQQWQQLVRDANAHEKEIGRSYYAAFINECSVLREKNQRLREALSDIAETETDWHYGVDENMQVVRNKAYIALQEGK